MGRCFGPFFSTILWQVRLAPVPTFLCDESTLHHLFLDRRRTLNPDALFKCEIPLPPLPEQRRIVARIEELAAKITEARSLRQQAVEEAERLLVCMAHRHDLDISAKKLQGWSQLQLADCIRLVDDSHKIEADKNYPNFGLYSFGRGLFHKPPIDGALTAAIVLRRVKEGQFIYSRLFAFEGAYGMVSSDFDGHFVSNEYPTFDCDPASARVEFVSAYFRSPKVWKDVAVGSRGLVVSDPGFEGCP